MAIHEFIEKKMYASFLSAKPELQITHVVFYGDQDMTNLLLQQIKNYPFESRGEQEPEQFQSALFTQQHAQLIMKGLSNFESVHMNKINFPTTNLLKEGHLLEEILKEMFYSKKEAAGELAYAKKKIEHLTNELERFSQHRVMSKYALFTIFLGLLSIAAWKLTGIGILLHPVAALFSFILAFLMSATAALFKYEALKKGK